MPDARERVPQPVSVRIRVLAPQFKWEARGRRQIGSPELVICLLVIPGFWHANNTSSQGSPLQSGSRAAVWALFMKLDDLDLRM